MLDLVPELRDRRRHPRDPGLRHAGRGARPRPCRAVPAGRVSCWRSSTRESAPTAAVSRPRSRAGCSSVPTTACLPRRSRCSAGPRGSSRSRIPSTNCLRRGRRSRAATSWRRPRPTWRTACRSTRSGRQVDAASLAPGLVPLPARGRRRHDHRRGVVGRPLRQLPAQRRPRAAPCARRRARGRHRGAGRRATTPGALGRTRSPTPRPSELVVLVDSYGMCTLALDRGSAADRAEAARRPYGHGRDARGRSDDEVGDEPRAGRAPGADPRRRRRPVRLPRRLSGPVGRDRRAGTRRVACASVNLAQALTATAGIGPRSRRARPARIPSPTAASAPGSARAAGGPSAPHVRARRSPSPIVAANEPASRSSRTLAACARRRRRRVPLNVAAARRTSLTPRVRCRERPR